MYLWNGWTPIYALLRIFIIIIIIIIVIIIIIAERFEPVIHFMSSWNMIIRVNVVLNNAVVVDSDWHFDNLCGSLLQSHGCTQENF